MHPNRYSLYSNLPPAMNAAQQTAAFATFEVAKEKLRAHLHQSLQVAQTIIAHATAAVNGEEGTKNDTKKYFEPNGPTVARLQNYANASNSAARSVALHALCAKQAIYQECIDTLKAEQKRAKGGILRDVAESSEAYFAELRVLERGYIEARDVIVKGNLRLVAGVASKHGGKAFENEDLMQYGVMGLQKAVEAFKPSLKNKFSTYAVPSIKGEITRACENYAQEIRIPCHVWSKMRAFDQVQNELVFELGRVPTSQEMAQALNIEVEEAEQLKRYHWDVVSIDAPVGEEEDGMTLGETLPDHNAVFNDYGDYADVIQPYFGHLDGLEIEVLKKTIGYGFTRQMSLEEIATETGLTKEAICGTIKSAIAKIATQRQTQSLAA